MRPNVYLPSVPTRYDPISNGRVASIDLKPAMKFGELVTLLDPQHGYREDQIHEAINELQEGLRDFQPDDYLLCVGDPILIAAAIAYASDMQQSVKVLRWEKTRREYDCTEITL